MNIVRVLTEHSGWLTLVAGVLFFVLAEVVRRRQQAHRQRTDS